MLIGVVGDYNPENETHRTLDASLAHVEAESEWISTDAVPPADAQVDAANKEILKGEDRQYTLSFELGAMF